MSSIGLFVCVTLAALAYAAGHLLMVMVRVERLMLDTIEALAAHQIYVLTRTTATPRPKSATAMVAGVLLTIALAYLSVLVLIVLKL